MQHTILIVEDEPTMRARLNNYLTNEGFHVLEAADGKKGLALFQENEVDLLLLDTTLPDLDGWSVCERVRKISDVPIIMMLAREVEADILRGFELGADDYVTKPSSLPILLARANRLLNSRARQVEAMQLGSDYAPDEVISCCDIRVHIPSRTVIVDGKNVIFTYTEFEILTYLMQNEGLVVTREQLIVKIWGHEYAGDSRTVNTHIRNIRHKLGDKAKLISTVVRIGYKFEKE